MPLEATLQALTLPSGTEFPPTPQALLDLIAEYMEITGLSPFSGINFGPTTPDADNRDRPWFKTTVAGDPVGWFSWDGSTWSQIPQVLPVGTTANRPASPDAGTQYFDTTINVALIFERAQWRTVSGSPGDVKFVKVATIEAAITLNPGWIQEPDSLGRLIGSAGAGTGLTDRAYGATVGAETTLITEANLPAHVHTYDKFANAVRWEADGNSPLAAGNLVADGVTVETNSGAVGGNSAISIVPPSIFFWSLVKS